MNSTYRSGRPTGGDGLYNLVEYCKLLYSEIIRIRTCLVLYSYRRGGKQYRRGGKQYSRGGQQYRRRTAVQVSPGGVATSSVACRSECRVKTRAVLSSQLTTMSSSSLCDTIQ